MWDPAFSSLGTVVNARINYHNRWISLRTTSRAQLNVDGNDRQGPTWKAIITLKYSSCSKGRNGELPLPF